MKLNILQSSALQTTTLEVVKLLQLLFPLFKGTRLIDVGNEQFFTTAHKSCTHDCDFIVVAGARNHRIW